MDFSALKEDMENEQVEQNNWTYESNNEVNAALISSGQQAEKSSDDEKGQD